MSEEIKAIETFYDGYRFRSRLEARWAVFFHEAGIPYVYEPEGFNLDGNIYYLPDFYLPWFNAYVEIKPSYIEEDKEKEAKHKLELLYFTTAKEAMIFFGDPCDENMNIFVHTDTIETNNSSSTWDWRKFRFLEGAWYTGPDGEQYGYTKHWINVSVFCDIDRDFQIVGNPMTGECFDDDGYMFSYRDSFQIAALKARQARFEHGEVGAS